MASADDSSFYSPAGILCRKKRKRVLLPLATKADIIRRLNAGEPMRELAQEYNLGYTTIRDLRDNGDKILRYLTECKQDMLPANKKIMKESKHAKLEEALFGWYLAQKRSGTPMLTDEVLAEKAACLNRAIPDGDERFVATSAWLQRFKNRHGIPRKMHAAAAAAAAPSQVPDLSDRMGLDGAAPPPQHGTKMEGAASNYQVTCSPLISAMHEDFLLAGAAGPSHDAPSDGEHHHRHHHGGDYEHEDTIDVKAEPLFNVSPEICEDENSQNNTESSSERPSSQSSPTPGMAGPYLLKKETHCTTILDQLLRDDTFSDVTLTAEGQSIRAHKIVLCLASAYFRQVLSKESTVQNVIVFRDIKFSELKNLINFIYTGEATVDAAELESFMKTAEMLEVTSLCDGQRSIPRNFLPRYREPEMTPPDKPRTGASKRAHQSSLHSPPSKSRRVNEGASSAPPPSKHSRATTSQPSTSAAALPLSAIKSEPVSVDDTDGEDVDLFRTRVHYDDHDNNDDGGGATTTSTYDHRAKSPSQYQDMDQSPPVERRANSPDKVVPGKCPFCPPSQPQLRQGLALTKHLVTSHPEQPCAPCDACSRVFLTKAAFHAHKHDCNR